MATFRERRRADRVLRKTMRGERAQRERNDDKTGHSRRAPAVGRTSRILKSFNPRGGPRRDALVRSALKGKLRHVRIFKNLRECSLSGVGQHPTWQMEGRSGRLHRPAGCHSRRGQAQEVARGEKAGWLSPPLGAAGVSQAEDLPHAHWLVPDRQV